MLNRFRVGERYTFDGTVNEAKKLGIEHGVTHTCLAISRRSTDPYSTTVDAWLRFEDENVLGHVTSASPYLWRRVSHGICPSN
jgi:hypothetical protein